MRNRAGKVALLHQDTYHNDTVELVGIAFHDDAQLARRWHLDLFCLISEIRYDERLSYLSLELEVTVEVCRRSNLRALNLNGRANEWLRILVHHLSRHVRLCKHCLHAEHHQD